MSENAGIDPRVAAAEQAASQDDAEAPDQTMVAEDPAGGAAAGGVDVSEVVDEPDGRA